MSDILTKAEFYNSAIAEITANKDKFPFLESRIRSGDVRITQEVGAIAQMCAMLSFQIGVAGTEIFEKVRPNIILADASIKGIFPLAKPSKYKITFLNNTDSEFKVDAGRRVLDNKGRVWVVEEPAVIPASSGASLAASQVTITRIHHTVLAEQDFYRIAIPEPEYDTYIAGIRVFDSNGTVFKESYKYNNIDVDEKSYQIIVDEMQKMYIQFGVKDVSGYVPLKDEIINIEISYSSGNITLNRNSIMSFEYINQGEEDIEVRSGDLVAVGSLPKTIDQLAEFAKYPFLYDENTVYLGEFEFNIKNRVHGFQFISVWNEQIEEEVRGPNVDNINKLFVSFLNPTASEEEIQKQIVNQVKLVDNSYKVKFVPAVKKEIPVNIKLLLPVLYDPAQVQAKVTAYLVDNYGEFSEFSQTGNKRFNWQQAIKELRETITELADGISDISITADETDTSNPEVFKYITHDSIKYELSRLNQII